MSTNAKAANPPVYNPFRMPKDSEILAYRDKEREQQRKVQLSHVISGKKRTK
jgi:hypothetical protein